MELNPSVEASNKLRNLLTRFCFQDSRFTDPQVLVAKSFILKELLSYGYSSVETQAVEGTWGTRYNLIARNFTNLLKARVVIGAHYDTVHGTVGADDNGSGVVMALYLAEVLKSSEVPVEVVFFVNEEPPYFGTNRMGSKVYFDSIQEDLHKYTQFINLDCVGMFTEGGDVDEVTAYTESKRYVQKEVPSSAMGLLISEADTASTIFFGSWNSDLELIIIPGSDLNFLSDLRWFVGEIPAAHLVDMAMTRNSYMHTPEDTPEKLDYIRMGKAAVGVAAVIRKGWK